jgi:hypothetical protein
MANVSTAAAEGCSLESTANIMEVIKLYRETTKKPRHLLEALVKISLDYY